MDEFPIIKKLGGRESVRLALTERGLAKSKDAIRMWTSRRRIPGNAIVELHEIARLHGVEVEPADFRLARCDCGPA